MTLAVKYERLLRSKVTSPSPDFNQLYALVIDDWHQQHRKKRRKKQKERKHVLYTYTLSTLLPRSCVYLFIHRQTDRRTAGPALAKFVLDRPSDFVCSGHFEFLVGTPAVRSESHIRVVATRCQETHRSILFDEFLKIPHHGFMKAFSTLHSDTCTARWGTVCPSKDHK